MLDLRLPHPTFVAFLNPFLICLPSLWTKIKLQLTADCANKIILYIIFAENISKTIFHFKQSYTAIK